LPVIGIAAVEAPWGPVHLAADTEGVVALEVMTTHEAFASSVRRRLGETPSANAGAAVDRRLGPAVAAVEAFLAGEPDALGGQPFVLHGLTPWDLLVLDGVRRIPWGEVTSYGRLAGAIGRLGAARAVGAAVGRNPIGLLVPCHRVIAGDGSLGGYGGSWMADREALLSVKRQLLALEGSVPTPGGVTWTTFAGRPA
jgi:methylated-DNA-[protein]-cysteine S-methyltransferase